MEGTNPPQFTTQLSLTTEGEYTYKFQALDKENLSDSQPIHAPVWITAGSFTVTGPTLNNCTFPDLDNLSPFYSAINYLCNLNVISGDDETGLIRPDDEINRAELAKIAFKSIELENASFADYFPCPYNDLQDEKDSWYYSFAKNLLYLEYENGIPPFDRNRFNFYPSNNITRSHVLKVLI